MTSAEPGRWDLTPLFADGKAAIAATIELAERADRLAAAAASLLEQGRLSELADAYAELDERLEEANDYARMRQYEDAAGDGVQETVAGIQTASTRGTTALERVLDAWRALDDPTARQLLDTVDSGASAYRLRRARAVAAFRLAPSLEEVWAARTESARDRWAALQELLESRLRVPFDDGTGVRVWGIGDLGTVLRRPEPELRRAAQAALAGAFGEIRDLLAIAWDASVADRLAEDRLRGRSHPAEETLEREDFTLGGFQSLVDAVPPLAGIRQRFLAAQADRLGLPEFRVADADAPVGELPTLSYDEVTRLALAGLQSLHPVLAEDGQRLVAGHRVDGEPRAGKQQYAVTFATRLDPPAFLSFRYTGSAANVPLLGHELGHAVALARAAATQDAAGRGWPGVAFEVPSLTAELAAGDAFVDAYPESASSIRFVLGQDVAWSVFEAMAFCRTELDLYEARAAGTILTGDVIQDTFKRRFGELYGPDVPFDDDDALVALGSWANYAIPSRFYNFQYTVGALVALALHAHRREDPTSFGARYVAFLSAGRSASPADLLADLGVRLGAETWAAGLGELERRLALAVTPSA